LRFSLTIGDRVGIRVSAYPQNRAYDFTSRRSGGNAGHPLKINALWSVNSIRPRAVIVRTPDVREALAKGGIGESVVDPKAIAPALGALGRVPRPFLRRVAVLGTP
jgi:hypothetical protein